MGEKNRWAGEVADWCARSLDNARVLGRSLDTRPFVQNIDLIIAALRAYEGPTPMREEPKEEAEVN